MISRKELFALDFYKKSAFTGSDRNMCYRIERVGDDDIFKFQATVWEGPYSYAATPEEKKVRHLEDFSEEGLNALVDWMNEASRKMNRDFSR